ncbi:MAG TPA: hypothetical protein VIJ14_10135, partial [Rhabdochlamydiaceae bacterium]
SMKITLIITLCSMGLLLASCSEKCPAGDAGYSVIRSYAKESKKNELWHCTSIGGGFDYDRIRTLATSFEIDDPEVNIDEARVFFVNALEGFLTTINNDPNARPYLAHYPFTCNDVRFGVSFPYNTPLFTSNVNVAYVSIIYGKIYYRSYDKEADKLTDLCNEDYSEALKIVQGSKDSDAQIKITSSENPLPTT